MLVPKPTPRRYREHLSDPDNAMLFERGRHHVVDDRKYRWTEGAGLIRGASSQELLAIGTAWLCAEGAFEIFGFDRARLTVRQGLAKAYDGSFVRALAGSETHLKMSARFHAEANASVHLYGADTTGTARDDVVIFLHAGALSENVRASSGVRFLTIDATIFM